MKFRSKIKKSCQNCKYSYSGYDYGIETLTCKFDFPGYHSPWTCTFAREDEDFCGKKAKYFRLGKRTIKHKKSPLIRGINKFIEILNWRLF